MHLPAFLVDVLAGHRVHQDHSFVFTGSDGGLLRRSNFRRRVWLPATGGDHRTGWQPICPGLHFHDLRHTHKTWLIEDGVAEVAQAKRLGHRLAGVRGIYSHVTPPMVDVLLAGLQHRCEQTGSTITGEHYQSTTVVKINCSPFAPRTAEQPASDDHQQAV